jgi:hypothetical protein
MKNKSQYLTKKAKLDSAMFRIFISFVAICFFGGLIAYTIDYFQTGNKVGFSPRFGWVTQSSIVITFLCGTVILITGLLLRKKEKK